MQVEGGKVRLSFNHVGAGLAFSADKPRGFTIAGFDQKFVPADASIDGECVLVTSADVLEPKAVRYAWANYPEYSLFNKDGLPASPFRTDDWPLTTAGESRMFYDQIGLDDVTLTPRQ